MRCAKCGVENRAAARFCDACGAAHGGTSSGSHAPLAPDTFELSARRGLTKFVGRERELEQLWSALELAIDGRGQIVAVVAEAGTGKSRLFYEFKAKLPQECKFLEAYSVSHGKASAWLPVLELLRNYPYSARRRCGHPA